MKRVICLLIAMMIMTIMLPASADEAFLDFADTFLLELFDATQKQSFVLSASGTSPLYSSVYFDFTDGNQTILSIDGDKCKVYAFFEDDELLSILFRMIQMFDNIESQMTNGKKLEFEIKFAEDDKLVLHSDNIQQYFSWLEK